MAGNTAPLFTAVPHTTGTQFANADGITKKTLFTPGTNGSRIDGISVCSGDTVARNLAVYLNDGSTDHYLGNVQIPSGAGYTTVARVDALAVVAPPALGALVLESGHTLKANMVVAVTSSDVVDVVVLGGDF